MPRTEMTCKACGHYSEEGGKRYCFANNVCRVLDCDVLARDKSCPNTVSKAVYDGNERDTGQMKMF